MRSKNSCPVSGEGAGKVPDGNSPTPYSTARPLSCIWFVLSMSFSIPLLAQDTSDPPPLSPSCRVSIYDIAAPAPQP